MIFNRNDDVHIHLNAEEANDLLVELERLHLPGSQIEFWRKNMNIMHLTSGIKSRLRETRDEFIGTII